MPRGVDEIELVASPIRTIVEQSDTLGLDRNPPLSLQLHGVEHLLSHFPIAQPPADLDKAIGKGRLTVVDMGNDGKISYVRQVCHWGSSYAAPALCVSRGEARCAPRKPARSGASLGKRASGCGVYTRAGQPTPGSVVLRKGKGEENGDAAADHQDGHGAPGREILRRFLKVP